MGAKLLHPSIRLLGLNGKTDQGFRLGPKADPSAERRPGSAAARARALRPAACRALPLPLLATVTPGVKHVRRATE